MRIAASLGAYKCASHPDAAQSHMKIATFNINDIDERLANLLVSLRTAKPDVVCLQELKSSDEAFPIEAIKAGYSAVFRGQRSSTALPFSSGSEKLFSRVPRYPAIQPTRKAAISGRR